MANSVMSAMARTPLEIWWIILEEVIESTKPFSTVYNGDDWIGDSSDHAFGLDAEQWREEDEHWEEEDQRQLLASVCKAWRRFAMQRKSRSICLGGAAKDEDR
jgi:hypothetical protein